MTDSCIICGSDAIELDEWFLKVEMSHGKIAVIECICPWCVKDAHKVTELFQ